MNEKYIGAELCMRQATFKRDCSARRVIGRLRERVRMRRRFMENVRRMGGGKTIAPAKERFIQCNVAPLPLASMPLGEPDRAPAAEEPPEVLVNILTPLEITLLPTIGLFMLLSVSSLFGTGRISSRPQAVS